MSFRKQNRSLDGIWPRGVFSLLVAWSFACASSQAPSGSPTQNASAPQWVHSGNRVEKGSFFGVGMVSGINDTQLARTSACNRGRDEVSRTLETYSTSLMKDFQESVTAGDFSASSEGQVSTNAIKTFAKNLLNGSEPIEYWKDEANGSWFCLIELNFERSKIAAAGAAKMNADLKGWVDQHGGKVLDDMSGGGSGGGGSGGQEPPPVKTADPEPPPARPTKPPPPPPAEKAPDTVVGGKAPAWKDGQCDRNKFLCGVGEGKDRTAADLGGRTELAKIFTVNIKSVAASFESASRKISSSTGETWQELQSVSQYSLASTEKVVTMSEILERWDSGKNKVYALAVIERDPAANALRDQIEEQDSKVSSAMTQAQGSTDKLQRFKAARRAAAALVVREALNADLRVIDKSGRGIPPPHDIGEIMSLLEGATEELSIGVVVTGASADKVQSCLEEALTAKGYQVEAKSSEDEDDEEAPEGKFDVLIKASIKAESKGKIAGNETVKVMLSLKLINGKTNKILRTITGDKQSSRGDVANAKATAVHQLCKMKVPDVIAEIDKSFR